jgi:hypothetical protein
VHSCAPRQITKSVVSDTSNLHLSQEVASENRPLFVLLDSSE